MNRLKQRKDGMIQKPHMTKVRARALWNAVRCLQDNSPLRLLDPDMKQGWKSLEDYAGDINEWYDRQYEIKHSNRQHKGQIKHLCRPFKKGDNGEGEKP